jgi:hypothetical protein
MFQTAFRQLWRCVIRTKLIVLSGSPTNSTEQSPSWEINIHSSSQEIPRILWKLNDYYRVNKDPPLVPILSQMNPVHTFSAYFLKILSNIIIYRLSSGSSLQVFKPKHCMLFSSFLSELHAPRQQKQRRISGSLNSKWRPMYLPPISFT